MDDRANLPYTDAVIHECMRMGNIVPLSLPHITIRDMQLGGYTVPKVNSHICNFYVTYNSMLHPILIYVNIPITRESQWFPT